MATQAEIKQRNLESSILYLQQEHSTTLKGLHEEIQLLQKKNSELTFQVAMFSTSTSEEGALRKKVEILQHDLKDLKVSNNEYDEQLTKKDRKISVLEQQLRAQEKKFADELKTFKSRFKSAHAELDAKSANIAQLTHQLHTARKELMLRESQSPDLLVHQPAPPKESAPRSGIGRRIRKNIISADFQDKRPHSSSSSGSSSRDLLEPVLHPPPDPTPFLPRRSSGPKDLAVHIKKKQDPLPPILPHTLSAEHSKSNLRHHALGRVKLTTDPRGKDHVVKLAVDHMPGSDVWRQAESKSAENR
ncbi:coiled-coil domain-containing protein 92-like [Lineus longissimus]|uniref:coiled-coil domain-containing protein 92-like n=1 Tax=Lineus longissimus TaxID=88925 RepID=UPI002B4D02FC